MLKMISIGRRQVSNALSINARNRDTIIRMMDGMKWMLSWKRKGWHLRVNSEGWSVKQLSIVMLYGVRSGQ